MLIVIQARLGSHRFPRKVLADLEGRPVLQHVIERCKKAGPTVLAIPSTDIEIVEAVGGLVAIYYHPGDENDVLSRYYHAAKAYGEKVVTRITADCPMVDPQTIRGLIEAREQMHLDYISNEGCCHGFDVECFTFDILAQAHEWAKSDSDKEHVTPWIRRTARGSGRMGHFYDPSMGRPYRLTVDEEADLEMLRRVVSRLGSDCRTMEIIDLLDSEPSLVCNSDVKQRRVEE